MLHILLHQTLGGTNHLEAKQLNTSWQTTNPQLNRYAYNVISGLQTFTADDLHVLEAEIERQGRDRRVIGSILKHFESTGLIQKDGYTTSSRRECHGRPIVRWRVCV